MTEKSEQELFSEGLHQRLDGEETHQLNLAVLESFYKRLRALSEFHGWTEDDGIRQILAAGVEAIRGWRKTETPLESMEPEERVRFLQDRAASLDAAYATLKFQAYQAMIQNDTMRMNVRGLMPRLEAATQRVAELEDDVRRLRKLVPPEQRQGKVLVRDGDE
jgi:hypothetical protein